MPLPPRADPDIRFSVILPVHQGERYLEEALESLRAQPAEFRKHLEVIAVDDGSTDRSPEILQAWKQELRVTLHSRQGGSNWMSATNDGLKLAQGTWISFLHQDDLWDPQRLPDLDQAIRENPEVRFFCHPVQLIGPSGKRFGTWNPPLKCGNALEVSSVMPRLVTQNPLGIPAPCFHRSLLEAENGLREDLWFLADWDFWLRLLSKSRKLLCLPDALASFRIHPESQTMTRSHQEAELRTQFGEIHEWVRQQFNGQHPRERAARLNAEVTITLANYSHRLPGYPGRILRGFLALGPAGMRRFLYETRLKERVVPRIKMQRAQT